MTKNSKASPATYAVKGSSAATVVVRNSKTGELVKVRGVGALKGESPKLKRGISLLEPIAKQALAPRARRRKAQ